jgi:hypothetical protein
MKQNIKKENQAETKPERSRRNMLKHKKRKIGKLKKNVNLNSNK